LEYTILANYTSDPYIESVVSPVPATANTAVNAQCGTNAAQVRVAIAGYTA